MRKVLSIVLVLMLALTVMAPAAIMEAKSDDIVILHTNDVHTYIDGELSYDVIAGVKAELEKMYNYVILADAGDAIQGTAFGSMDKGATIVKLMNAAGYDVATLGNHEFDYGMEGALTTIANAEFPYVSCNFYHEDNYVRNENVLDSYVIFVCGDMSVAFIGMTTPETFTKSTPAYFQDGNGNYIYGIAGGDDGSKLYNDVQATIDELKELGVDKIFGLGHLGDDKASQPWTSEEVIANTCGLDAFIDGHSHSTVLGKEVADKEGNAVILNSTGEYFGKIGMMVIDSETGAITCDFITVNELTETTTDAEGKEVVNVIGYELASNLYTGAAYPVNEEVKAIKDAWIAEINTKLGEVIGSTELTFNNYDEEGNRLVRSQETNTGDLAADSLYWLFDEMGLDVDVAIMNGGGVRNKAVTGEISYLVAKQIHTFGNVACLQTITGQQLLDALEWGARFVDAGKENGGFLHVSGITYQIDSSYPESVVADEKGVWVSGPTAGYRVHDVMVYNKETGAYEALDVNASYNLAGYNYTLRDLGDGFAMFDGAINVLDYVMEDYMVVSNYISDFENGVVEATNSPLLAKYPGMLLDYSTVNGSGRIVVAPVK